MHAIEDKGGITREAAQAQYKSHWIITPGQRTSVMLWRTYSTIYLHPLVLVQIQMVQLPQTFTENQMRGDVFRGSWSPPRQTLLCRSYSSCHLLYSCTNTPFYCFEEVRLFCKCFLGSPSLKEMFFLSTLMHVPFRGNYFSNLLLQSRSL